MWSIFEFTVAMPLVFQHLKYIAPMKMVILIEWAFVKCRGIIEVSLDRLLVLKIAQPLHESLDIMEYR